MCLTFHQSMLRKNETHTVTLGTFSGAISPISLPIYTQLTLVFFISNSNLVLLILHQCFSPNPAIFCSYLYWYTNHAGQWDHRTELFTPFRPLSLPGSLQHDSEHHPHISTSQTLKPILWFPKPSSRGGRIQPPSVLMHQQHLHLWWSRWAAAKSDQWEEAQEDDIEPWVSTQVTHEEAETPWWTVVTGGLAEEWKPPAYGQAEPCVWITW